MEQFNTAYLSIGSNMGDREGLLKKSIELLNQYPDIFIEKVSSIYETDPVGFTEQPLFLNVAIKLKTSLSPQALLSKMHEVEDHLDRKRVQKWGPRTIDLDILLYNSVSIQTEDLEIPHPRMLERAFVLIPLSEIAPDNIYPDQTISLHQVLCEQRDKEGVRIWKKTEWEDASVHSEN
ncbi:2-amino-4-hydroxy-6-hydroxymethyldihydropteridine diphosphokinase [Fictibacillus phosphorivorans]|uniref:2-amino-4-hydroxy-6- hydroxymethyldihydropteridine diphosphokinase n=1 Tax=Fictibacillus phosphorivorans TaxID=1221500 RepID=UPI00203FA1F4|nr:2-amino-4-hydroxy-6-hydroxymethyldihydropteridine diphosphokinase [Fictibacillus phosphorivorans]MCM3719851.1 2-amino-4-hydroxy-6-hydroxymethyldihydropteridine diphosphokinase [Fictibacillus phosphorivorans]MCM3777541.1 2-amino-4-hydroxy-6-hydroxymethyldihydropteridine diphosphokinase [Fictibacillus phosphorivorans]